MSNHISVDKKSLKFGNVMLLQGGETSKLVIYWGGGTFGSCVQ